MAKKYSKEQIKIFLDNLALSLLADSKFVLRIQTTSTKNRFFAEIAAKNGNTYELWFSKNQSGLFFYQQLSITGLNQLIAKTNPILMLRPNQILSVETIISTLNLNADETYSKVFDSIKNHFNYMIKNEKTCAIAAYEFDHDSWKNIIKRSPEFSCIEELMVWADLSIKAS